MASEKVKKSIFKRWWFWVLAVILIIIIASTAAGGGGNNSNANTASSPNTTTSKKQTSTSKKTTVAKIGQPVQVGKLVYTVNSMKYEKNLPDAAYGAPSANGGVWLVLNVTVKNGDSKTRTIDTTMFTVMKGSSTYDASAEADTYINNNTSFFLDQLNSGLSAKGYIAFDVPSSKDSYVLRVGSGMLESSTNTINLKK